MSQNSDTLAVNQLFIAANHCKFHMFSGSFICSLSPIQDELFRGCSRMRGGGGGRKKTPSLKSVKHILQCSNLAQLYLTQRRFKKYMNHATHPLSSADIHIFSPEISKFCCIKKYGYRLHFDTQFLSILTFLESL